MTDQEALHTTPHEVDTEYVAEALRREGEGVFYYHRPEEPQLFRTRESAILGIRQFLIALGPADVVPEGYDVEAIFRELVHTIPTPHFYADGHPRWVYAITADQETVGEVILRHELSVKQLLAQISERVSGVGHKVGICEEPVVLRAGWIDDELGKIAALANQVRRHRDIEPHR